MGLSRSVPTPRRLAKARQIPYELGMLHRIATEEATGLFALPLRAPFTPPGVVHGPR